MTIRYRTEPLETYVADAAAGQPTPGGGSVSGLVGTLAAAMGEMAANFTAGREKFADVEAEIEAAIARLADAREKLLCLMQDDVEAYAAVGSAYGMSRKTDEEKAARRAAVQKALKDAMRAPLEVMRQCAAVGEVAERLAEIANPNLITDVGVSAILAAAAGASARLNVEINLKYIKDAELVAATRAEVEALTESMLSSRSRVGEIVSTSIG